MPKKDCFIAISIIIGTILLLGMLVFSIHMSRGDTYEQGMSDAVQTIIIISVIAAYPLMCGIAGGIEEKKSKKN
jgi:hypothetical protein